MTGIAGAAATAALSALLAAGLFAALRRRGVPWLALGLGLLPPLALYLWNANLRVYSFHGLLHTSVVYELMHGHIPPECTIFAGEALLYPWAYHLLAAGVSAALTLTPFTGFALLNLVALVVTLAFVYRAAAHLAGSRAAGVFAGFLSVFAPTFLSYGPLAHRLAAWTGLEVFALRNPIVAQKFTTVNTMPPGFAALAVFLYALVRIFSGAERPGRYYALAFVATLTAGFLYPILWLTLLAGGGAVGTVVILRRRQLLVPELWWTGGAMAAASLLVAPYLYAVSADKAKQMFLLRADLFVLTKLAGFVWILSPLLFVLYWKRDALARVAEERGEALLVLSAVFTTTGLMYVLIGTDWNTNEYKFLEASLFTFGLVGGVALAAFHRSNPWVAYGLCTLLLFDITSGWVANTDLSRWRVADPYVENGRYLHHADPKEDALYRWIARETEPDAAFLDTRLTIPAFARRPLYVGYHPRKPRLDARHIRDGWNIPVERMLRDYYSYPPSQIRERRRLAKAVFDAEVPLDDEALVGLREAASERSLYVVAREEDGVRGRLAGEPLFRPVFRNGVAVVYRVLEDEGGPARADAAPGPRRERRESPRPAREAREPRSSTASP